LFDYLTIG